MQYKYILFDLDGTLTDSKEGITKSVQYALSKFGIEARNLDELQKFIGPPLYDAFIEYYGFSEEKSLEAVKYYRERFREKGIFENKVYEGIPELLERLKESDFKLIIATSKPTEFSEKIVKHFDIYKYFDDVVGSEFDGTRGKKDEVIQYILDKYKIAKSDAVMIGDRKYDMTGAHKSGIAAIGVTFGFGSIEELKDAGADYIAGSPKEIGEILLKEKNSN